MDVEDAKVLAEGIMREYGLDRWTFRWDASKRRFGRCRHLHRVINLSKPLVALNDRAAVEDTIRHEVAHALVGRDHGHDAAWKAMCRKVGARPVRCYDSSEVVTPPSKWIGRCDHGCAIPRHKLSRSVREHSWCKAHASHLTWGPNPSKGVM